MGHTPGPWDAKPNFGRILLNSSNCYEVAEVFNDQGGFNPADIHLMAAAPDLLEACELLLIYLGDWNDMEDETCAAARRAIAKARGQEVPNG
jgi:hypothetical protein